MKVKPTSTVQSLQEREGGQCSDYVQFYANSAGSFVSPRFCGNEMSEEQGFRLSVPSTELLAVFWSDGSGNGPGFKLLVSCDEQTLSHG